MIAVDSSLVIAAARSWIGTPYHHQASVKGVGTDCLGLARGVWREVVGPEPTTLPPYTPDWGETGGIEVLHNGAFDWMIPEPRGTYGPGSLVLFRMRETAIAKHMAIITYRGSMVHAYHGHQVIEEHMTKAWQRRIAFSFQYPAPAAFKGNA